MTETWKHSASTLSRILILGGTGEGVALAEHLASRKDLEVISSLGGRVGQPRALPGQLRVGGFGGVAGLVAYLEEGRIDVVIDVTHPFAAQMSDHAGAACMATGIPLLHYVRPAWTRMAGDTWYEVADFKSAAEFIDHNASRVFLAIGRQELEAFARCDHTFFLIRAIDQPAVLPLRSEVILQRGPFDLADELRLLREHAIDTVVSKNSGGQATYGKIEAARMLGIQVVMIDRPLRALDPTLTTLEDVFVELDRVLRKRVLP